MEMGTEGIGWRQGLRDVAGDGGRRRVAGNRRSL